MKSNSQVVKAAIDTGSVSYGLLNAEQSRRFLQMTFDKTNLRPLIRHEIRQAKTGEVDKIGIGSRILRSKVENTDDNYRAKPVFGQITYSTTPVRLPWEITEETLRENIEGEGFEAIVSNLMATQLGIDLEDLELNGDTATAAGATDYDFLKINDGWLKLINNGGHVVDRSTTSGGSTTPGPMSLDVFNAALKAMPNKYNNGKLRWLMSPGRRQQWEYYILNQAVSSGGIITDNRIENPFAIPSVEVASLPDDKILLLDPQNLIEVTTYGVIIRKTTEGKEASCRTRGSTLSIAISTALSRSWTRPYSSRASKQSFKGGLKHGYPQTENGYLL
jgi:hypothetical protein